MARLTHPAGLEVGRLTLADVPAAAALSAAIDWNQDEADWRRLVELHPEGCVAARLDGELVGTATLVRYPGVAHDGPKELAWLGMVIAHPKVRGRGVGAAVTDAALGLWEGPPGGEIGLDATEFGAPIYRRRGFEAVSTIDRWAGRLEAVGSSGAGRFGADAVVTGALADAAPGAAAGVEVSVAGPADLADVCALDRRETGVDRSALLTHTAAEEGALLLVARRDAELVGYLASRRGRHHRHVGPVVAASPGVVSGLLDGVATSFGAGPVFLDSVRGVLPGELLISHGLSVGRSLLRMTRQRQTVFERASVAAAFDFAWG